MNLLFEGIHYVSGGSTSYATDLDNNSDGFVSVKVRNDIENITFIPTLGTSSKNRNDKSPIR